MSEWVAIATKDALAPGERIKVDVRERELLLFNINGEIYAVEDVCTHDGGPLSEGTVKDCAITCPRHGASFDLRSGEVLRPPAYEAIAVYEVRINGDEIEVLLEDED